MQAQTTVLHSVNHFLQNLKKSRNDAASVTNTAPPDTSQTQIRPALAISLQLPPPSALLPRSSFKELRRTASRLGRTLSRKSRHSVESRSKSPDARVPESPRRNLLAPASRLDDYTVLGDVKSSGSATASLKFAVRKSTGERVVLKYEQKGSFKHQCRVMNGIKTSLDLHHPSIMRLYEAIDAGDTIVLVQEYITGDDLFQYIVDHGPMPEPLARTIFHQIASTVLFLHERHIVHRDLKPENVMVNDDGNIKLIDFGFSCDISNGALHTSSCGSPNYAAPEIVSGKPYRGPEIDTWSLGAVLYAMLCARMTFDGHVQDVLTNIKSGTYEKPTSLSPEAQNLIAAMLTVDPEQRITLAQVMNHPFIRNDEAEGAGRPSDVDKPLPRLPDDDSNDGDISLTVPQVVLGTSVRVERTGSNAEY